MEEVAELTVEDGVELIVGDCVGLTVEKGVEVAFDECSLSGSSFLSSGLVEFSEFSGSLGWLGSLGAAIPPGGPGRGGGPPEGGGPDRAATLSVSLGPSKDIRRTPNPSSFGNDSHSCMPILVRGGGCNVNRCFGWLKASLSTIASSHTESSHPAVDEVKGEEDSPHK